MTTVPPDQVRQVLDMLYHSGIHVTNSREAYNVLKQYESDPTFAITLGAIFSLAACPLPSHQQPGNGAVPWLRFRLLAGLTLKNNIQSAKTLLGEAAVTEAAKCCVAELRACNEALLVSVAAQIAVKTTTIVGIEWWTHSGVCDLASLLLDELLLSSNPFSVLGGLYCLQFLLEDAPKQLGGASEVIVSRVSAMASDSSRDMRLRLAAFKVASHPYELGALLEWNVDTLSPMQQGLCNASGAFASCCTLLLSDHQQQTPFTLLALRAAMLLLDYVDYFMADDATKANHIVAVWVAAAVHHITHPTNMEIAAAACDFIAYAMAVYERSGGEGCIFNFGTVVTQYIPAVMPKLFDYICMTKEEYESVMERDHFSIRDAFAVVSEAKAANSGSEKLEDAAEGLDDEEAASSLRKSASSCIDKVCAVSPNEASPHILSQLGAKWNHSEWQLKEGALLGFGSAVRGCYAAFAPQLSAIAGNLNVIIQDEGENVCVISMAVWCVQRIAAWLVTEGTAQAGALLNSIAARLVSSSKRVQASVVTALKHLLRESASAAGHFTVPVAFLEQLVTSIHSCIQSDKYNTGNLSALCDVALFVLALLPDSHVGHCANLFFEQRTRKMASFRQTYEAAVVQQQPNILVDKDVLFIDKVVVGCLQRLPNPQQHVAVLQCWSELMWDIASRSAYDDADLVFNTIFTAGHLVRTLDTNNLLTWLSSRNFDLAKSALQILEFSSANSLLRSSCVTLMYYLISVGREQVLQDAWVSSTIYRLITSLLQDAVDDDPALLDSISQLVTLLICVQPNDASLGALLAVCSKLRADVFGDSLEFHLSIAYSVCETLKVHPSLLDRIPLSVVCELAAGAPNTLSKSLATQALSRAVASALSTGVAPASLSQPQELHQLLRLVYSWQQAAASFQNGTHEALQQLLHSLRSSNTSLGQAFHASVSSLPEAFRQQLLATYQLA